MMKWNPHNFKIQICGKESFQQLLFLLLTESLFFLATTIMTVLLFIATHQTLLVFTVTEKCFSVRQKKCGRGDKKPARNNYGKLVVEEIAKRLIDNFGFWNLWRSTIRDWGEMTLLLRVFSEREENLAIMMFVRRGFTRSSSHRSD